MKSPSKTRMAQLSKRDSGRRVRLRNAFRCIAMGLMMAVNVSLTSCGDGSSDQANKQIIVEGSLLANQFSGGKNVTSAAVPTRKATQEAVGTDRGDSNSNLLAEDNPGSLNIAIDQTYQEEQKNSLIRLTVSGTGSPILNFVLGKR
jgi:hypothetical protein